MNAILGWLTSPEWAQVVKTLLHSLWQAGLVALVLGLLLRRIASPAWRYRFALCSLGGVLIAAVVSWAVLNQLSQRPETFPQTVLLPDAPLAEQGSPAPDPIVFRVAATKQTGDDSVKAGWTAWLALVWILGALAMVIRAGVQMAGAERLRRSCKPLADERVSRLLEEAQRAVQLARRVRIAVTDKLTSPAVVGVLVPTLILPLTLLTALTPEQLRFVLLHELAHIRRGDYFANLFQLFMEALLFFNPAVWWISHLVRREREACCDALAIELSGAPVDYAKTLVQVAENVLSPAPAAATAFGDGQREPSSLSDRVQRLLVPGYRPALGLTWRAMLAALLVGGALLFLSALGARNVVGAVADNVAQRVPMPIENTNATTSLQQHANGPIKTFTNRIQSAQSFTQALSKSRQAIVQKLDQIKFDKLFYVWTPLDEVVRSLVQETRKRDPDHKGVNFIIDPNDPGSTNQIPMTNFPAINMDQEAVDVTLHEALELIVKGSSAKIHYSIEDYGIVFGLGDRIEPLFTRTFRLNLDVVSAALGVPIPTRHTNEIQTASDSVGTNRTNETSLLLSTLRDRIRGVGVEIDRPGEVIFLNEHQGTLLVRATIKELDAIESFLQAMDTHPPEVNIKAWFYEISDDDLNVIGIDWLRANARVASVTGYNSGLCGVLTEDQFKIVQRSMEQRGGVKLLFNSKVTTLSGRQAQIIGETKILTLTNGINPQALRSPGISIAPDSTNRLYLSNPIPIGPVLDVIPQASFDEFTIKLTLSPSISEFLGYDKSEDSVEVYIDGKRRKVAQPLPRFRVRQLESVITVWDGQTVVLGGFSEQILETKPDGQQEATHAASRSDKQLLVFVTATVIDPAGNRVHSGKEIPAGIPPQSPPNIKSGSTNSISGKNGSTALPRQPTGGKMPVVESDNTSGTNQAAAGRSKRARQLLVSSSDDPVPPLYNRMFMIESSTLFPLLGLQVPNQTNSTASSFAGDVSERLREWFENRGVDLQPPKTLFFNPRLGKFLVHAPMKELGEIESLVQALNVAPQIISLKASFIEVPAEQMQSLLRTVFTNAPDPGTNQFIETLSEARTKALLSALKTIPGVDVVSCPAVTTFSGRQAQVQAVEVKTPGSEAKSVHTNGAAQVVSDAEPMSFGPMIDVFPIVATDGHTINMTVTPAVKEFVGFDEHPRFYDSPVTPRPPQQLDGRALASELPAIGSRSRRSYGVVGATRPTARYRVRRVTTPVSVWDGQTVLFGNIPSAEITRLKDKVAVLGVVPEVGRFFRSEAGRPGRKQLIVLITPTIVDPAGNRVYPGVQADGPNW